MVSGRPQYLDSSPSAELQVVIQSNHLSIEGLLSPTGIEPTLFRNSASKVAGLQLHGITPDMHLKR